MDDAWVKDVLLPLSIGIVGTFIAGILLALSKLMMERCCAATGAEPSPGPSVPGIVESGDQPLAQSDALYDVEMGILNGGEGEAGLLSGDVGANGSISRGNDGGLLAGRKEDIMADGLQIHVLGRVRSSRTRPLNNASASGV